MGRNGENCERKLLPAVARMDRPRPRGAALPSGDRSASAFVLGGGGNLGAVQVGMIHALIESGIRPGMIVGTSVGAINGAFLASRTDLDGITEIARFWSSLRRRDVLGISLRPLARGLLGQGTHLFDPLPMRRVLESFLHFRRLEDAPIPLAVVATDLATGEPVLLESGDAATALLASAAIPRVLPPVEIGGRLLVDGAAAADVPLQQALSLGARNLYVLPTAPLQLARMPEQPPPEDRNDPPVVHVMTPPDVRVALGDLSQSRRLIELGYDHGTTWLAGKQAPSAVPAASRPGRTRRRRVLSS